MGDLALLCLMIDDDCKPVGAVFVVRSAATAFVGDLAKEIQRESSDYLRDVHSLILYAHDLILWKTTPPLPADSLALYNELQTFRLDRGDRGTHSELNHPPKAEALNPAYPVSKYFRNEDLAYGKIHVLVQLPADRKRKREAPVDVSKQLKDKWNDPFPDILNVVDLRGYLDTPLGPEEKIPISDVDWRELLQLDTSFPEHYCSPEDLGALFTKNEDETAKFISLFFQMAIVTIPPDPSGTESSFIAFWDINIVYILLACIGKPKWIRNSNQGTQTGSFRPDLGLLLRSACVFRGEEKKPTFSGKHPRQELADKTRWVYDPAPYILGYHAVGADITLVAILPGEAVRGKKQTVVKDIGSTDLSTRQGRIGNAVRMIRLVKLLRTLERIVARDVDRDMFPMNRDDGKSIQFLKTKIRKIYRAEDLPRVLHLQVVYGHLKAKGVPNVDRLTKLETSHPEYGCFVELEPLGDDTGPKSANDVTNAAVSILEALKVLHTSEPRLIHRDIRWANVMKSITDSKKWFLIDWEDAAIAPAEAAPNLRPETHAPQVFKDGHGAEVDIWGVGRLIDTANVPDLSENLLSLGQRMVEGSVLSAEQGLEELIELQSSIG